jgi:hypothetical protein
VLHVSRRAAMALDYTIIQPVRQRFGDGDYTWELNDEREVEAPFVGRRKEFAFSCPNVDPSQMAALHFESFGLSSSANILEINGVPVPGGLKPARVFVVAGGTTQGTVTSYGYSFWKAHALLVEANILGEQNVLHIASVVIDDDNNYDNFIIDNVVIFFKTRSSGGLGGIRDVAPS